MKPWFVLVLPPPDGPVAGIVIAKQRWQYGKKTGETKFVLPQELAK